MGAVRRGTVAALAGNESAALHWEIAAVPQRGFGRGRAAWERSLRDAQHDVRTAIARDLHDGPVQTLTAMIVQLEELRRVDDRPVAEQETIGRLADSARGVMSELRAMLCDMRAEPLVDGDVMAALRPLVHRFSEMTGIAVDVTAPAAPVALPLPKSVELQRIVGEALTNVARHAHASIVQLTVQVLEDTLAVTVSDDGCGMQPLLAAPGVGLKGMRERAALLGARLSIDTGSQPGTRVRLVLPLEHHDHDEQ